VTRRKDSKAGQCHGGKQSRRKGTGRSKASRVYSRERGGGGKEEGGGRGKGKKKKKGEGRGKGEKRAK